MILANIESLTTLICLYSLFFATICFFMKNSIFNTLVIKKCGNTFLFLSNISMMILLINRWVISKHFPLSNLYESTIFLAWSLSLVYFLVYEKNQSDWLGLVIAPTTMFTYGFAVLGLPEEMQQMTLLIPALQSYWLMMHVSMMILSYAALLCGSLLSMTLLIAKEETIFHFFLKDISNKEDIQLGFCIEDNKHQSSLNFNKNLAHLCFQKKIVNLINQLDYWSFKTISIGFPFLTIGIMSGAVWANEAWGSYWSWDPKETWAFITWLIFAIYLHSRITQVWNKELSAIVASCGFIVIWICYLGVNLLGKGLHSYGWLN